MCVKGAKVLWYLYKLLYNQSSKLNTVIPLPFQQQTIE
jgi:hypothetical protein